ncbi:MAG: hypothetical protein AB7K64_18420 [Variibacter sp.]
MPTKDDQEEDAERLHDKLQDIQQAMNAVEIWAGALAAFAQSVPLGAFNLPRESR